MSFSFEILSEGSLVSLFGNPRFLDWSGVHFACAIRDLYLFFWLVVRCPVKTATQVGPLIR